MFELLLSKTIHIENNKTDPYTEQYVDTITNGPSSNNSHHIFIDNICVAKYLYMMRSKCVMCDTRA